jgi:hypothetical protein
VAKKRELMKALKALFYLACRVMSKKNTFNTHSKQQTENSIPAYDQ